MSQIGSSSGVRVAATPLSNVYTVLLLIGALVLALTLAGIWINGDRTYGVVWGITDSGKANLKALDTAKANQEAAEKELNQNWEALKQWPAGMVPPVPPAPGTTAPAAPTTPPAAPATPPATPAAPATPPATPAAPAAPAPPAAPAAPATTPAAPAAEKAPQK
jgi:hypothetical protein